MPRILLIEDNEENQQALARRLERRGYDVVIAGDGKQGDQMTKSERPELVLMDMNMPVLDGWQASHMIRNDPETQDLPIIGLTAHALAGDREKAIQAGCSDYHTKPVDFPRLMAQIEALIRKGAPERSS